MPASILDVSSTSSDQGREPARLVADHRQEGGSLIVSQLSPASLKRSRRSEHGRHRASELVRDERDEVGAQSREPTELLHGRPLRLVRPDVLHRGCDEASEQRDELDLVRPERVGSRAADRQRTDRARAELERRHHARAQAQPKEPFLLLIPPLLEVALEPRFDPRRPARGSSPQPRSASRDRDRSPHPAPAVAITVARPSSSRRIAARSKGTSPRSSAMKAPNAWSSSRDEPSARRSGWTLRARRRADRARPGGARPPGHDPARALPARARARRAARRRSRARRRRRPEARPIPAGSRNRTRSSAIPRQSVRIGIPTSAAMRPPTTR